MRVYLETKRVILRHFTPGDADLLFELDSDPEVMRFLGPPASREEIQNDFLPHFLAYDERGDGYGYWAAVEKATGDFLGWFHLRPRAGTHPEEPELGYRLRRSAWGRGYATEVSGALLARAFSQLGARRVVASTAADNLASRRVMEKVGMSLEREYWSDEYQSVDVDYAVDRGDWARGREGQDPNS